MNPVSSSCSLIELDKIFAKEEEDDEDDEDDSSDSAEDKAVATRPSLPPGKRWIDWFRQTKPTMKKAAIKRYLVCQGLFLQAAPT